MDQTITFEAVQEHNAEVNYGTREAQEQVFKTKVLEMSPIKDTLLPIHTACIMCDDQERMCVTASLNSAYVPRNAKDCKKYIRETKDTPGCILHKQALQRNVNLTTYVTQVANQVALCAINQHRENQLLMMLCSFVEKKGIVQHIAVGPSNRASDSASDSDDYVDHYDGRYGSDYGYGADYDDDYSFIDKYNKKAKQLRFIRNVHGQYPDTHEALQELCPFALYTFDSSDTSFVVPDAARASFLKHDVMQLVTVIWPQVADDAWTSGCALYRQKIMDVRNDHRKTMTLFQLCSYVVKTETHRKAEEMRKEADLLESCDWLLCKLPE